MWIDTVSGDFHALAHCYSTIDWNETNAGAYCGAHLFADNASQVRWVLLLRFIRWWGGGGERSVDSLHANTTPNRWTVICWLLWLDFWSLRDLHTPI
jgi:hypothetical protein